MEQHAKLYFHPSIWVTAQQVAAILDISLEKADRLLSGAEARSILQQALQQAIQESLLGCVQQMARIPQERMPVTVDCAVALPPLPFVKSQVL